MCVSAVLTKRELEADSSCLAWETHSNAKVNHCAWTNNEALFDLRHTLGDEQINNSQSEQRRQPALLSQRNRLSWSLTSPTPDWPENQACPAAETSHRPGQMSAPECTFLKGNTHGRRDRYKYTDWCTANSYIHVSYSSSERCWPLDKSIEKRQEIHSPSCRQKWESQKDKITRHKLQSDAAG